MLQRLGGDVTLPPGDVITKSTAAIQTCFVDSDMRRHLNSVVRTTRGLATQ